MNVLQTGANVAVTQLKSNSCDEGQLCVFFHFIFPPLLLCAGDRAEFQSLLFSHSDSVGRREKEKKVSFSNIHTGNSSFCFLYVDEKIPGAKDYCLLCSVPCHSPACQGHHP